MPTIVLIVVTAVLPVLLLLPLTEFFMAPANGSRFHRFLEVLYAYLIGYGITVIWTDVGKYMAGRHRPDFLARCEPDYSGIENFTMDTFVYPADVCKGDPHEIREGKLSFPSGHSSTGAYLSVFMACKLLLLCVLS